MQEAGQQVSVWGLPGTRTESFCKENNLTFFSINSHKKYYDFRAGKQLANALKERRVAHLIIRDVRDMSVAVIAKSKSRKAFKVHYFMEMQLGVSKKNLLHTIRFRMLDTWSCPLEWLKIQVETMTRMPQERIVHIPSALDLQPFQAELPMKKAREICQLPPDAFLVGLAGRFDIQKGQLLLLEALSEITQKAIHIVFLGEPTANEGDTYIQAVKTKLEDPALRERVHIRPFRKDIEVFYKAINVFVMASKAETVGMVTLEAMASGCPVIGSNAGGTPEILGNGAFGFLFEPLNVQSLRTAIMQAYEHPHTFKAAELSERIEPFSHQRVIPLVLERLKNS